MNHLERFRAVMNCQPVDRLPVWEWATWWHLTIDRWHTEGLPAALTDTFDISQFFGQDPYKQFWLSPRPGTNRTRGQQINGTVNTMDDYLRIRELMYPDQAEKIEEMRPWANLQRRGEVVVWGTLEGFFWLPREPMDVERLGYAYFDQPELVHRINTDLLEYNLRVWRQMKKVCVPAFVTLAEDMSYNHGPMISQEIFGEFLAPYYRKLLGELGESDVPVIVDTDGDVTLMVPWLLEAGVKGVLPLERQARVDGMAVRRQFPNLWMIGHFDKMVMDKGEAAMRAEFERLMPLMKTGGFIPSVDHQTPPHIPLQTYRVYLQLLREYVRR